MVVKRAPDGSERPYIGVKAPQRSERVHEDEGPTEAKKPLSISVALLFNV